MEKRFIVNETCSFFPVFSKVIKQVNYPQESVIISVKNQQRSEALKQEVKDKFKFTFDWINEDQCGIEVFRIFEGD